MSVLSAMEQRRSVRQYNGQPVTKEELQQVLKAALLAPSGRGRQPWKLLVVRDKETLRLMSGCRGGSNPTVEQADCVIVVLGDPQCSDTWIEDCSIVLANMHLAADSLGLGSCWIQGRLRQASESQSSEDYLRQILHFPEELRLEALLTLGHPLSHPAPHDKLDWSKIQEL